MELNDDLKYQALLSRDARFDGVFFVGVSSTGIYCRSVCPAKTPRRENCAFYPCASAAEKAGYRPCLRCRPELAPGSARIDSVERLAALAVSRIEDGALSEGSVSDLASELGVTDRHLRRILEREYGVSPVELAQTQRLLLSKRLLTDTDLSITEIAFASGFASLRRFNALFLSRYRMSPTQLRESRQSEKANATLVCEIAYRPPFDWDSLASFLATRCAVGVEWMETNRYLRTVAVGKHRGWVAVSPAEGKSTLRVELSASLAPILPQTLARAKRQFDVTADVRLIAAHLGSLAEAHLGLRVPGSFDGFQTAVRAIAGQQVSVKAATTLIGRFVRAFGEPFETPFPELTHLFPDAVRIAKTEPEEIAASGILRRRADAIVALAKEIAEGRISLEPGADVELSMARLRAIPGIGEWTAECVAMRALSWPDAFPASDLGIQMALKESDPRRILEIAERWRPWRSYAVMHLWKSLEVSP